MACTIFAAMSASSVATIATIGAFAFPALAKRKYDPAFSCGIVSAGGLLAPMIPPAGVLIIYAAITDESLGKLFLAGIFPGLLMAAAFATYAIVYCKVSKKYTPAPEISWNERWRSLKNGIWGLSVPIFIIGGLYSGVFTVNECAALAAIYTLIIILVRRKIKFRDTLTVLKACTLNTTMILVIIIGALIMGHLFIRLQVTQLAMQFVKDSSLSPMAILWGVLALMIVLGCFMEGVSLQMIVIPIAYPMIIAAGFNGIWFGILQGITTEIGFLTPPVGMNLFVVQGMTGFKMSQVVRGMTPFLIIMFVILLILFFFPQISLWLPNQMIQK